MSDEPKTRQQLLAELDELRRRLAACEASGRDHARRVEAGPEEKRSLEALVQARAELESRMEQRNAELRAIYEGMFDGLLIVDIQTRRFVGVNPSVCRMLGYSEPELLSMSVTDVHPPEDVPGVLQRFQARGEGRLQGPAETRVLRKDGTVAHVEIVANTLSYGARPAVAAVFRDVTDRKRAQEALEGERRTLEHMLRASDHERQLIAYEIHDGLAQELAGAIVQFQIYSYQKDAQSKDAQLAFDGGMALLRQAHAEARRLISGVRPPILDESGVMAAIAHLVHDPAFDRGPKVEFRSRVAFKRLAPVVENVIYRIVQEGLANARNHSRSKTVRVSLVQRGDRLRIQIHDRGVGFDPAKVQRNRFGLAGIRERARLLGGTCSVKSQPGKGTQIVVELPVVERSSPATRTPSGLRAGVRMP